MNAQQALSQIKITTLYNNLIDSKTFPKKQNLMHATNNQLPINKNY